MVVLKREIVKYVRDKAKSKYILKTECEICSSTEELQLHHYYTLSLLISNWLTVKKYNQNDVLEWRDEFISEHQRELFDEVVTLCKLHHQSRLHHIYGQCPKLSTAEKQKRWVQKQREKYVQLV